jgi:hypothetical protein
MFIVEVEENTKMCTAPALGRAAATQAVFPWPVWVLPAALSGCPPQVCKGPFRKLKRVRSGPMPA